ncbi:MAG TPA: VanZ family protein, partial [Phycisphaerae bacterium]|nr:VanZ family protein [Phycisphaerae bacterium]
LLRTGFSRNAWHHWLVQRAGVYVVLTILLGASSTRPSPGKWVRAALLATCFAAVAEAAKPFIISRTANAANVVSSTGGAMMGLVLGRLFEGRWPPRLRSLLTVVPLAAYMVYLEWMPFAFTWDLSRLAEKMPRGAQWLPLYHYAMGGTANDVRLFLRTLLLVGALTYAMALRWRWLGRGTRSLSIMKAAVLAGCFGLILEFGQFFLERVPSITDVFCFAVGGALGYWVWTNYPHESAA